ncbi:MerR family transcriptional regulator [Tessaracoccus antarcticus]|uniref:MerR family transcriptional regulator n=1 Tax=Tessaracoccus antarcticus TaxID=2479848 RepID=A0A3M0GA11_9ACTN|nr:MerR family transcriptional regulator [Tessaracoccus antarcticus]RMB57839.1 MerR family transcriptional regulator [Tessaracoccus antarcticus]
MTTTADTDPFLGIGTVAAQVGVAADTIRYYERQAILPPPHRDASGRRRYNTAAIHLIEVLLHLRDTGMPLTQIAEFTRLVSLDPAGVHDRLHLLEQHRDEVTQRIKSWNDSLTIIDQKIDDYQQRLSTTATATNQ